MALSTRWQKADIIAGILTPVVLFIMGTMFAVYQGMEDARRVAADRFLNHVKSLSSEKVDERSFGLLLILNEAENREITRDLAKIALPQLSFLKDNDRNDAIRKNAGKAFERLLEILPSETSADYRKTLQAVYAANKWAVIAGAQRSLKNAKAAVAQIHRKIDRDRKLDIAVYFRKGVYRLLVLSASKEASESNLERIRNQIDGSAYIVRMATWCPDPAQKGEAVECVGG